MIINKLKKNNEKEDEVTLLCDQLHFDAKEAYKLLRTNVLFTLPDNDKCRKIGIVSAVRGEGKSTVAINLAYTLSETHQKVLLIDMDFRLPTIGKKLGVKNKYGFVDYLVGNVSFNKITNTMKNNENMNIILSGTIPPTPAELIGSEKMKKKIDSLSKLYDYIIIDLPPVNIVSDALVAKNIVDGFVLVVREGYSNKRSVEECVKQLKFLDANILGYTYVDANTSNRKYGGKYYKYGKYYRKKGYGYYKDYSQVNVKK